MTQKTIVAEPILNSSFNFADFQKDAIARLKSGQPLTGTGGILTPLLKEIINASLDCEMDQHLEDCNENGESNRRNGKMSKTLKTSDHSWVLYVDEELEIMSLSFQGRLEGWEQVCRFGSKV